MQLPSKRLELLDAFRLKLFNWMILSISLTNKSRIQVLLCEIKKTTSGPRITDMLIIDSSSEANKRERSSYSIEPDSGVKKESITHSYEVDTI